MRKFLCYTRGDRYSILYRHNASLRYIGFSSVWKTFVVVPSQMDLLWGTVLIELKLCNVGA
jgi:hypothetical protein